MIREWLCFLGFHRWHKARFFSGARVQSYGMKICEWCRRAIGGYARRNHPDFLHVLGEYDK